MKVGSAIIFRSGIQEVISPNAWSTSNCREEISGRRDYVAPAATKCVRNGGNRASFAMRPALLAFALSLGIVLAENAVQAQERVQLIHNHSRAAPLEIYLREFAVAVATRTANRLQIEVLSVELPDSRILDDLRNGKVQMGVARATSLADRARQFGVFEIPYLFPTYERVDEVLQSPFGEGLLQSTTEFGYLGLAFFERGLTGLVNRRPITSPKDIDKLRVRGPETRVWRESIFALGGVPIEAQGPVGPVSSMQSVLAGSEAAEATVAGAAFIGERGPGLKFAYTRSLYLTDILLVSEAWFSRTEIKPFQEVLRQEAVRVSKRYTAFRRNSERKQLEELAAKDALTRVSVDNFRVAYEDVATRPNVSASIGEVQEALRKQGLCMTCPLPPICCTRTK